MTRNRTGLPSLLCLHVNNSRDPNGGYGGLQKRSAQIVQQVVACRDSFDLSG
jgi:hypothetical protein